MECNIYAVVTSVQKQTNKIWVVVNDDKQEETHSKPEDFVLPAVHQFSLNVIRFQYNNSSKCSYIRHKTGRKFPELDWNFKNWSM